MSIPYTYWKSPNGQWLGCWSDYPDYWTQGRTLPQLRKMLVALRDDIRSFIESGDLVDPNRKIGMLEYA